MMFVAFCFIFFVAASDVTSDDFVPAESGLLAAVLQHGPGLHKHLLLFQWTRYASHRQRPFYVRYT